MTKITTKTKANTTTKITTKTNLCQNNTKEESSKEEKGKCASNSNSGSSCDQARVTEGTFSVLGLGEKSFYLLTAVWRRQMPGNTKMKTAARLPNMLMTALMLGISMARIMVSTNQVVAITTLLVFSHLRALSSLNIKSFSKESMPSLNRKKHFCEV